MSGTGEDCRVRVSTQRAGRAYRSGIGCSTALITGVVVFLAVSLVAAALFIASPANSNGRAPFLQAQPGSLAWDGHERLTVLLIGADGRPGQGSHSRSLTVASFDSTAHSLTILSIPSALWVNIPGFGSTQLSEAYADGGPRLTLLVVESVLHVPIPYYAVLGPDGFAQLVDALGGITINVPFNMNDRRYALNRRSFPSTRIPKGLQHMDGATALDYVRMPQPDAAFDVGMMQRQQQVLLALKQQALQPQTFFQIPAIVNSMGSSLATNFPYDSVQPLAHALLSVRPSHIHQAMLDTQNHTVTPYGNVLLPDWQHIRSIALHLFPPGRLSTGGDVEVLNGAGLQGQASRLADWLRQAGISVRGFSSATSFNYAHTQVLIKHGASKASMAVARAVAALLQVPIVSGAVIPSNAPIVVMIGHDFQDPSQQ